MQDDESDPSTLAPRVQETARLPTLSVGPIDIAERRRITKLCLNRQFEAKEIRDSVFEWYEGVLAQDVARRIHMLVVDVMMSEQQQDPAVTQLAWNEIWDYMVQYARNDESDAFQTCMTVLVDAANTNRSWAWQLAGLSTSLLEQHALAGTVPRKLILALYHALGLVLDMFVILSGSQYRALELLTMPWVNDIVERLLDAGLGDDIRLLEDAREGGNDSEPSALAIIFAGSIGYRPESRHFEEWSHPFSDLFETYYGQRNRAAAERRRLLMERFYDAFHA